MSAGEEYTRLIREAQEKRNASDGKPYTPVKPPSAKDGKGLLAALAEKLDSAARYGIKKAGEWSGDSSGSKPKKTDEEMDAEIRQYLRKRQGR